MREARPQRFAATVQEGQDSAVLIELPDLQATEALGRRLAGCLRAGDAVLLDGPLGAGKTALARALLRAACGDPALEVPSPSYTLVQSYDAPGFPIHHFDLWRLGDEAEVIELGWDEAREGAVLVEWPDRLGSLRPPDSLQVALDVRLAPAGGDTARRATLRGWEGRFPARLDIRTGRPAGSADAAQPLLAHPAGETRQAPR